MQQVLHPYAETLIKCKARRLVRRAAFVRSDQEDIEQELRLDLLRRLSSFDPSKATLNTFADRVVRHKIASIIEARKAGVRDYRRQCSLNEALQNADHKSTERGDTVDQDQVCRRTGPPSHSVEDLHDLAVDVDAVLSRLPYRLRDLCRRLRAKTPTEVSQETGIPRGSLYEAIEELRRRFKDADLEKYL